MLELDNEALVAGFFDTLAAGLVSASFLCDASSFASACKALIRFFWVESTDFAPVHFRSASALTVEGETLDRPISSFDPLVLAGCRVFFGDCTVSSFCVGVFGFASVIEGVTFKFKTEELVELLSASHLFLV